MDGRVLTERVRDVNLHVVAAMDAQRRAKIAPVVAKRAALPPWEERGAAGLCPGARSILALAAGIDQLGKLQFLRLGSGPPPCG